MKRAAVLFSAAAVLTFKAAW